MADAYELIEKEKRERTGYLDIGRCGLTELPDLSELKWLHTLIFSSWWDEFDTHQNEWVSLSSNNKGNSNRLTNLPSKPLPLSLKKIVLNNCFVSDGRFLEKLTGLTYLNLNLNAISDGRFLEKLTGLTSLYLGGNFITDGYFLKKLTNLTSLDLRGNQIKDLSPLLPLIEKGVLVGWVWGSNILTSDNPWKTPPPEIIQQGNQAILDYFRASKEQGTCKVFISYNHKDADKAHQIKQKLEQAGIAVTIDSEKLQAGGDIKTFIEQSIRDTDVTLSLVSTNSLFSAWVGMESLNTLTGERIAGKRFIACAIQTEFFQRSFVRTATEHIDKILQEIKEEASHRFEHGLGIDDLQNERTRYLKLKNGLPEIVANLKERLTIDLSDGQFEEGMKRVIDSIR